METTQERINILPKIEVLQAAAKAQIRVLMEQKTSLEVISTDLTDLIQQYNAQKSYLGHAAYWYGEQEWWVKLVISTLAAAVATLVFLPVILSIALSLIASFLLQNHYQVTKERDQWICKDLQEQNESVQLSLVLLNTTKENLEQSLETLCQMNIDMGHENIKLRENISSVTQQAELYKANSIRLQSTIDSLQSNEQVLSSRIATVESQLEDYERMLKEGILTYVNTNKTLRTAAQALLEDSNNLRKVTEKFKTEVDILTEFTSPKRTRIPDNSGHQKEEDDDSDTILKNAVKTNQKHTTRDLDQQIQQLKETKTPPRHNNSKKT